VATGASEGTRLSREPLLRLDNVGKVLLTDEVETHALSWAQRAVSS